MKDTLLVLFGALMGGGAVALAEEARLRLVRKKERGEQWFSKASRPQKAPPRHAAPAAPVRAVVGQRPSEPGSKPVQRMARRGSRARRMAP